MNETVTKLWEQAAQRDDLWEQARYERFAELLIRECASLAKTKSDSIVERAMKYAEDTDEETSAKATAWQFLVFEQEIKQHFGVEE